VKLVQLWTQAPWKIYESLTPAVNMIPTLKLVQNFMAGELLAKKEACINPRTVDG